MHSKKVRSIQSTFIITYFFLLVSAFLIFMVYFAVTESTKISNESVKILSQNVNSINSYLENDTDTLETIAQNISYSNLVKDRLTTYLDTSKHSDESSKIEKDYNSSKNTKELIDIITAIVGPNQPVSQIYLYTLSGESFGVGLDTSQSIDSAKKYLWYPHLKNNDYKKIYTWDNDERLSSFYSYKNGSIMLSLCSEYYNQHGVLDGIIEVKKPVKDIEHKIDLLANNYDEYIYIFDSTGKCVYPTDTNETYYYELISNTTFEEASNNNVIHFKDKNKTTIFFHTSDSNGFTTTIVVDNWNMYAPIFQYIAINILLLVCVGILSLILSYFISRILTTPIKKIYTLVGEFYISSSSNNEKSLPEINTYILELNVLYDALVNTQRKVQIAMEREITLQNQEMQARMLALQSQMNPHFLHNSLATLQSMADEGMNDNVIHMCQIISKILRYISSDKELLVPLKEDLEHTKYYLECMKIRYDDMLQFEIDIPRDMENIKIPKLCLQLLVENSIKFSTKSMKPPWKIKISGLRTQTYWEIFVEDNGIGFPDEVLHNLKVAIENIDKTGLLPSLEINGMGLLNIYIRFKLLYKGNHIFRITNRLNGGAVVTIGGNNYE